MIFISETTFTNSVMTKVSGDQSSVVNVEHVTTCRDHMHIALSYMSHNTTMHALTLYLVNTLVI